MPSLLPALLKLYVPLLGWIGLGWLLGKVLPKSVMVGLGKGLFWVGMPLSIITFLLGASLSGWIIVAPVVAWAAMLIGAAFAWIWIDIGMKEEEVRAISQSLEHLNEQETTLSAPSEWKPATQGSFFLAMMVGNTGYMGFPIVLNLVGQEYFAWALFYDIFGTFIGVYGVGTVLASRFGSLNQASLGLQSINLFGKFLRNPALWSMAIGFLLRMIPLPVLLMQSLKSCAWIVVNLALVLIGMQLSQLVSLRKLNQAISCVGIKMMLVPLIVGTSLMFFEVPPKAQLALVLQMGMPPAFATIIFAEAYQLDQELAVTVIMLSCICLLFLLPVWVFLFGQTI